MGTFWYITFTEICVGICENRWCHDYLWDGFWCSSAWCLFLSVVIPQHAITSHHDSWRNYQFFVWSHAPRCFTSPLCIGIFFCIYFPDGNIICLASCLCMIILDKCMSRQHYTHRLPFFTSYLPATCFSVRLPYSDYFAHVRKGTRLIFSWS